MQTRRSQTKNAFALSDLPLWFFAIALGAGYYLSAQLGTHLSFVHGTFVPFWLPIGLYTAALLLCPLRAWPLFILAACAGNLTFDLLHGTPFLASLGFLTANTVQAATSAWLLRRFAGPFITSSLKNFLFFLLFGVVLGPALAASIGAATLASAGLSASLYAEWQVWWAGSALAVLLLLPLIVSWRALPSTALRSPRPARVIEAAALLVGMLLFIGYLLVSANSVAGLSDTRLMLFPLWAGLRFGTRGATAVSVLLALLVTYALSQGYSEVQPALLESLLNIFNWQIFLAMSALVALVPAIVLDERDRTLAALHDSELRFRRLTEASFEGICIVQDGLIIECNKQLLAMSGFKREELIGAPALDCIAPESRAQVKKALRTGEESIGEHVHLRRDGSRFWAEIRIRASVIGGREVLTIAVRDISERKAADNEILLLNTQLEKRVVERTASLAEANKELEAFSYSVSHDLRAPLRHIAGFTEMLKQSAAPLNEEATRQFTRIISAVHRMNAIVEGLLTLAHLGRAMPRKTPVDLGVLVDEVREQLAPEMRDRNIEWTVEPLPFVEADPELLRQALVNLLDNAVKYSAGRDFARIHVGLAPEVSRDDEVVVYVRDNGAGFDARYAHKLFDFGQRLHSDAEFEGVGIGLANVQRIIQRHGGRVWAQGAAGEGATFYFSLPAMRNKTG